MTTIDIQNIPGLSLSAARKAEQERNRGRNRSPVISGAGKLVDFTGPHEVQNGNFTNFVMRWKFEDFEVLHSVVPLNNDGSFTLETRYTERGNINNETIQMVQSANEIDSSVDGPWDLIGKWVEFDEAVHEYLGSKNTGVKGDNGKDIWENNVPMQTYFYRVTKIGKGSAKAKSEAVNPQAEEAAAAFAVGKTDAEFFAGVMPYLSEQALSDVVLETQIATRKFLPRVVSEGKIRKNESGTYELV